MIFTINMAPHRRNRNQSCDRFPRPAPSHARGCPSLDRATWGVKNGGQGCLDHVRLTMERLEVGWTVTAIHLDVTARIPGGVKGELRREFDGVSKGRRR